LKEKGLNFKDKDMKLTEQEAIRLAQAATGKNHCEHIRFQYGVHEIAVGDNQTFFIAGNVNYGAIGVETDEEAFFTEWNKIKSERK